MIDAGFAFGAFVIFLGVIRFEVDYFLRPLDAVAVLTVLEIFAALGFDDLGILADQLSVMSTNSAMMTGPLSTPISSRT